MEKCKRMKRLTVYVKELGIFLTMKVLENTPAVLSLGKLCDENGYSYEWINGQKPHLIKNGIRLSCNSEHFVLWRGSRLVNEFFLRFSSFNFNDTFKTWEALFYIFFTNYDSIKWQRDSRKRGSKWNWFSFQCLCPVPMLMIERRSPLFADSGRASSEIPEWLQEFREILVDDGIPVPWDTHASSSHEVSLDLKSKRLEELGKHSVYTHFLEDRNCEICHRIKITRAPCRRRIGGAVPRAENFGDLMTADHKDLSENCESRNIEMQSWCRTWPPNGSSRILPKQKLLRERKEACTSSWSQRESVKSVTLTIPWNLAKPVKLIPGIIVRQHHAD